jgi:hypothetical protein
LTRLPATLLGLCGLVASGKAANTGTRRPAENGPPKSPEAGFGSRTFTYTYTPNQVGRIDDPAPACSMTTYLDDPGQPLGIARDELVGQPIGA